MPVADSARSNANYGAVSVANTATQIVAAGVTRRSVSVYNNGAATVYVGDDSSVTTSTGMPIPPGAERELQSTTAVYGIVSSGTADVRYWEEVAA